MSEEFLKTIIKGILELLILRTLLKKPMHGYELMNMINKLTGLKFTPGVIYPILYKLEEKGLIESEWHRVKERRMIKLYNLTDKGAKTLKLLISKLKSILSSI